MNKKIKIALLSLGLAAPLLMWIYVQYTASQENNPFAITKGIAPPVKSADIPMESYVFNNDSAFQIVRSTGTKITIPPHSFRREDGQPLKGLVDMQVREFHSASDILQAGINMSVNLANGEFLQSAGMIELRAFNEGKKLEVADNKEIEVGLAGFRNQEKHRLYYFEEDSEWAVKDSFEIRPNTEKEEALKRLAALPPKPEANDSNDAAPPIFYFEGNVKAVPKLAALANRGWRMVEGKSNTDFLKNIRINWDDFNMTLVNKRSMIYEFVLSHEMIAESGDTIVRKERFRATPVMAGDLSDQRTFDNEMKNYEELVVKMEQEAKWVEQQADMLNTFKINKLGVYNIDRLFKCDPEDVLPVSFDFTKELDSNFTKMLVYGVYEEDQSVIPFTLAKKTSVYLPRGKRMKFVAVLPGDKVAVVEHEEIKGLQENRSGKEMLRSKRYPAAEFFKKG